MSERDVEQAFARLRGTTQPSGEELRAIARSAAGHERLPVVRRRRSLRWGIAAAVVALLAASGLGFGLGSSVTPSGGAADPPAGLGFLPERGWQVVRSRFEASPERPSFATASNVPLARQEASLARRVIWSGQPWLTLQNLKPHGIVLVASFALRGVHAPSDASFPRRRLPLRLRDSAIEPSFYSRRLGSYTLRAAVGEHNVIVNVYFGTLRPARASIIAAQRQLDRLVVGSTRPAARVAERALPLEPPTDASSVAATASRTVDRTFACRPMTFGGIGDLDINVSPPRVSGAVQVSGYLVVRTAGFNPESGLVGVRPRPQGSVGGWLAGPAGVFAHSRRCTPAWAAVPLSSKGLPSPPLRWQKELDCPVHGRVLVRVRSVLKAPAEWRRIDRSFDGVRQPVVASKLAVRLERSGKPIAYMEHDAKGETKLWYSSGCS